MFEITRGGRDADFFSHPLARRIDAGASDLRHWIVSAGLLAGAAIGAVWIALGPALLGLR